MSAPIYQLDVECGTYCLGGCIKRTRDDTYGEWVDREDHEKAVKEAYRAGIEAAAKVVDETTPLNYGDQATLSCVAARIRTLTEPTATGEGEGS